MNWDSPNFLQRKGANDRKETPRGRAGHVPGTGLPPGGSGGSASENGQGGGGEAEGAELV